MEFTPNSPTIQLKDTQTHEKEVSKEIEVLKEQTKLDDNQFKQSFLMRTENSNLVQRSTLINNHVYEEEIEPPTAYTQMGRRVTNRSSGPTILQLYLYPQRTATTAMATETVQEGDTTNAMITQSTITHEMIVTPNAPDSRARTVKTMTPSARSSVWQMDQWRRCRGNYGKPT